MASVYPGALDSFATNKVDATTTATDHKNHHNDLADATNKIEAELGINPSGAFATLLARLDDIDARRDKIDIVKDYGADPTGNTDSAAAINAALLAGRTAGTKKPVYAPPGTFRVDAALTPTDQEFYGSGVYTTEIRQQSDSLAVMIARGASLHLHDMGISHLNVPTGQAYPNGVGIRCANVADRSVFERLLIQKVTAGIYCNEPVSPDATNYMFSTTIRNCRVFNFTKAAMYLTSTGAGNTGCEFQNIYAVNVGTGLTTNRGYFFGNFDEGWANQLNVEWGKFHVGIEINSCRTMEFSNLHFEQVEGASAYDAYINIVGTNSDTISIRNWRLLNCKVNNADATFYSLLRFVGSDARVWLKGVHNAGFTSVSAPTLRRFYTADAVEGLGIYAEDLDNGAMGSTDNITGAATTTVLRQINDQNQYSKGQTTLYATGAGKTTVVDGDFPVTPRDGCLAVIHNSTDNTYRLGIRANGAWRHTTFT